MKFMDTPIFDMPLNTKVIDADGNHGCLVDITIEGDLASLENKLDKLAFVFDFEGVRKYYPYDIHDAYLQGLMLVDEI